MTKSLPRHPGGGLVDREKFQSLSVARMGGG